MQVTFRVPGADKHTFGPYEMESIPRKDDEVVFETVSYGRLQYRVLVENAEFSFRSPRLPIEVTVYIYGPYHQSRSIDPHEVIGD